MGFKMDPCPYCEKKMPKHILVKHVAKSHPTVAKQEVDTPLGLISIGEGTTPSSGETASVEEIEKTFNDLSTEDPFADTLRWDFQKSEICATCGEEHPALLMIYHAHIRHGV